LSGTETILSHLRHVKIAQLSNSLCEKYICALDVPVDDIIFMQSSQTLKQFIGNFPDKFLLEADSWLVVFSFGDFILNDETST